MGSTVGTARLRSMNVATVLDVVRSASPGPLRLAEIAERAGLTRPTVAQVVDELLASGWLDQHDPDARDRGPGRPAIRVALRGRAAPVLGLDVGPHTVTAAVADAAGDRLASDRRRVVESGSGWSAQELLDVVDEVVAAALGEAGVAAEDLRAVVVATPGVVDTATGRVVLVPSIPGWADVDLVGHVQGLVDCGVVVDNDANLAALAIAAGRGGEADHEHETVLAIHWGERLGAGVVIGGRVHRGAGAAGEVGFITPEGAARAKESDGRGPLERAVAGPTIAQNHSRAMRASEVFDAAADGEPEALRVVRDVARTFARAVAPAMLVLDPHAVVIGGGVARAGEVLRDAVVSELRDLLVNMPDVQLSPLVDDAVVSGAVRLAIMQLWSALDPRARAANS